ncbi:unnamed protein product [Lactuca saligna]|uniref:MULE transposase domain-containing protein n=1 Tax=Lactuca saligna TaxID=75948 RepID=A0AA35ZRW9_LACSI|nr:unnamed protein product [Lactuca saligna]
MLTSFSLIPVEYNDKNPDANDLHAISIEDETLGVFDDNQSNDNHQHVVINGKQYWIPKVPDEVKPKLKGHYKSYEDITNMYYKYDMVFVPFTGIDNHKRCVTFGAGLLSKDDINSYTWLLKSVLKAFGKQPILVLSDEDPMMKNAIANVFLESIHRLCMWHITSKLPLKIKEFRPHGYSTSNRPHSDIESDDDDDKWDKLLKDSIYTVKCDQKEDTFICSCMKFEQFGIFVATILL